MNIKFDPRDLLLPRHRGLLLDAFVFLVNLFVMRTLLHLLVDVIHDASSGVFMAQFVLLLMAVGIFILPPIGAILKRWPFHHRLQLEGKEPLQTHFGCFFNPLFYFCLMVLIYSCINAGIMQFVFQSRDPGGPIFISSMFLGLVLIILHTYIVYRYFTAPKHEPRIAFLKTSTSERIGDICLFLNMLIFQLAWNLIAVYENSRVESFGEFAGRVFIFCFLALLIYFPPRMFYLAEDIKRPRTWLIMLLANSPVMYRFLIGS